VGEHAALIRERLLADLGHFGVELDRSANQAARPPARISARESRVEVWVLHTDEESVLAEEAVALVEAGNG
jgi:acetate kinase